MKIVLCYYITQSKERLYILNVCIFYTLSHTQLYYRNLGEACEMKQEEK